MNDKDTAAGSTPEVFRAPLDLSKKVRKLSPAEAARFDPVKAAESAVAELSEEFTEWLTKEVDALKVAWASVQASPNSDDALQTFFRAAHDIKGQADTLGFPLIGEVAGSLTELISAMRTGTTKVPQALVTQHVDAICAMLREDARDHSHITGRILVESLAAANEKLLEIRSEKSEDNSNE
ncbi:Hpt domain-containing protein [Pseudovibrio exalbescens]|uniref:HPt domain-containing protein n=1 Tax=Pseudovibrio exalbescens TaxID=197461 RepID=A0A1U7JKE8_9HYPH|nr:Hpt domain-containing protein [Pseudovibrio exalbescens]OKL45199.1 hypothetical protein A3843_02305 [Pseudovibrio exalbescens]